MELSFLYKGLILGISVSAPVGPIGILCINRTINKGYVSGFISGLGATTADSIYGIIAGLGLTVISGLLLDYRLWLQIIGAAFLIYLGYKTLSQQQKKLKTIETESKGLIKDYLTTFILTISNPLTILFFIAVFAGLGISSSGSDMHGTVPLIFGVVIGSGSWWLFLSSLTFRLRKKLGFKILNKVNLISGIVIISFGILLALDFVKEII